MKNQVQEILLGMILVVLVGICIAWMVLVAALEESSIEAKQIPSIKSPGPCEEISQKMIELSKSLEVAKLKDIPNHWHAHKTGHNDLYGYLTEVKVTSNEPGGRRVSLSIRSHRFSMEGNRINTQLFLPDGIGLPAFGWLLIHHDDEGVITETSFDSKFKGWRRKDNQ